MLPNFEAFFAPALHALGPDAQSVELVAERCAEGLDLSAAARQATIDYDGRPTFVARTQMALQELAHAGLAAREDGGFILTEDGRAARDAPPTGRESLEKIPAYRDFRRKQLARRGA